MNKKEQRQAVKEKCNGKCAYCETPLGEKFHVDHLIPVRRIHEYHPKRGFIPTGKMENPEMDCFENMLPSCASCNIAKSSMPLEHFREIVEDKLTQLERESNYRMAKRYGMIIEKPKKIVFYFEKLKLEMKKWKMNMD